MQTVRQVGTVGQTIIREGDIGDKFYLIARGKAQVSRNASGGSTQLIAVLQDGDHFGEIALVRNVPRIATVSALTPCLLLTLRSINFELLLEKFPLFRDLMLKSTAERMH